MNGRAVFEAVEGSGREKRCLSVGRRVAIGFPDDGLTAGGRLAAVLRRWPSVFRPARPPGLGRRCWFAVMFDRRE